jgi:hypothetical protein
MDAETSRGLVFSVHFGKFYLVDAERCFDRHRGSISCADIEAAVVNGKKNFKIGMERPEFDSFSLPDDRAYLLSESSSKTTGRRIGNSGKDSKGSTSSRDQKKKANVSNSFWSSLPMKYETECNMEQSMVTVEEKIRTIADLLHYQLIAIFEEEDLEGDRKTPCPDDSFRSMDTGIIPGTSLMIPRMAWKVEVVASANYSTHVSTPFLPTKTAGSGNMVESQIVNVHERFMAWVHATLLAVDVTSPQERFPNEDEDSDLDTTIETNVLPSAAISSFRHHDLRIKIGNNKRVPLNSDLYNEVMPQGRIPVELNDLGRPSVRTPEPGRPHLKEKITFIRRVMKRVVFASPGLVSHLQQSQTSHHHNNNNNDDGAEVGDISIAQDKPVKMVLILSAGIHYEGVDLQDEVPFIDLSLDGDMTEVSAWIQGEGQGNLVGATQSLSSMVDEILHVSEFLREMW